jgi:hypothetical protein
LPEASGLEASGTEASGEPPEAAGVLLQAMRAASAPSPTTPTHEGTDGNDAGRWRVRMHAYCASSRILHRSFTSCVPILHPVAAPALTASAGA